MENEDEPKTVAMAKKPRGMKHVITLLDGKKVSVYAGKKIADALTEISKDMGLYHGVRMSQVLEAMYEQGKKDGARDVFEQLESLKQSIPHRIPGRQKQPKKRAGRKKGK